VKWFARRTIEKGEYVIVPTNLMTQSPDLVAVLGDDGDAERLVHDATVISVPHPDMDVHIVATGDVGPEESMQMVASALSSPSRVTVPIDIPPAVKTVGDFFEEDGPMATAIANKLALAFGGSDAVFACDRCAAEGVELRKKFEGERTRHLCRGCWNLEL
jgi:hypothetical protein